MSYKSNLCERTLFCDRFRVLPNRGHSENFSQVNSRMENKSGRGGCVVLLFGLVIISLSLGAMGKNDYTSMDDKWWAAPLSIVGSFIALMGWSQLNDRKKK